MIHSLASCSEVKAMQIVSASPYTLQYRTKILLRCSVSAQELGKLLLEFSSYLQGYFMGVVR
jgi:hypothetical protein